MKSALRLALVFSALASAAAWADVPASLSADIPAQGLGTLTFSGGSGEAKIGASSDDAVHLRLTLKQQEHSFFGLFHWYSEASTRDLKAAQLVTHQQGAGLTVSLAYPGGDEPSDVMEEWTVQVPARFAVDARMMYGELVVKDVIGGVHGELHAGEAKIEVPSGPVTAHVRYGRLHVVSAAAAPGDIHVSSGHGIAVLSWNGRYFGPLEQEGFWSHIHLIGNQVDQHGGGADKMDVRVSFGAADLRIGPLGEDKTYRDLFSDD